MVLHNKTSQELKTKILKAAEWENTACFQRENGRPGCEQNGFLKKELPTQILCLVKNNFPKQKEREAFPAEGRPRGLSPPHRCRRVTIKNYLDRKEINEGVVAYQDGKTHTKQTHEQKRCTFHSLDFWIRLI